MRRNAIVTSLDIARNFDKDHDKVIRDIEVKIKDSSKEFSSANFGGSFYIADNGKEYPMYVIRRNGAMRLIFSYQGKKAAMLVEAYMAEFDRMERQLEIQKMPEWQEARVQGKVQRRDLTDILMLYVDYSKEQGSKNQTIKLVATNFTRVANEVLGTIGVLRDQLSTEQLRCLDIIEMTQANAIYKGMENSVHYKKIFQDMKLECKEMYERFLKPSVQRKALTQSTMPFLEVSNG